MDCCFLFLGFFFFSSMLSCPLLSSDDSDIFFPSSLDDTDRLSINQSIQSDQSRRKKNWIVGDVFDQFVGYG